MKAKGRMESVRLSTNELFKKAVKLDKDKVECGEIYVAEVDRGKKYSISMLFLAPKAKVRMHMHTQDTEWYFDLCEGNTEFCGNNRSHELENVSENYWLQVLSIKKSI